jgi:hypothetical protein
VVKFRYAEGLHPVWGFLAPPKSYIRTIGIGISAAVLGATAGSFSLIERSRDETSVAARTLVTQQPSSALLSAQEKSQSAIQSDPTKLALSAPRTDPTYLAHVQKKANKKHQAGLHYASLGRLFSSLRDGWYRAVGL